MSTLTLATASLIVDAALGKAEELGYQAMTVAVLDTGGHLKVLKRGDGTGILRPEIAVGKAWACLGMGLGGRVLQQRAAGNPPFFGALGQLAEGRFVPAVGGVLIRDDDGQVVGAVGCTGDRPDRDEECVIAGILAARLHADTGAEQLSPAPA